MQSIIVKTATRFDEPSAIQAALAKSIPEITPNDLWEFPNFPQRLLIDAVRQLQLRLTQTGGRQITNFVLTDFHESSGEVQNALLKSLEEPPANVRFILMANSLAPILATVQSRCRLIAVDDTPVTFSPSLAELELDTWPTLSASTLAKKLTKTLTDAHKNATKKDPDLTFNRFISQAFAAYEAELVVALSQPGELSLSFLRQTLVALRFAQRYLTHNVSGKNVLYFWAIAATTPPAAT